MTPQMEEVRHSARKLRTESRGTDGLKRKTKSKVNMLIGFLAGS